jgi:hypothetical protein
MVIGSGDYKCVEKYSIWHVTQRPSRRGVKRVRGE